MSKLFWGPLCLSYLLCLSGNAFALPSSVYCQTAEFEGGLNTPVRYVTQVEVVADPGLVQKMKAHLGSPRPLANSNMPLLEVTWNGSPFYIYGPIPSFVGTEVYLTLTDHQDVHRLTYRSNDGKIVLAIETRDWILGKVVPGNGFTEWKDCLFQ